jgi:hypothetical protein
MPSNQPNVTAICRQSSVELPGRSVAEIFGVKAQAERVHDSHAPGGTTATGQVQQPASVDDVLAANNRSAAASRREPTTTTGRPESIRRPRRYGDPRPGFTPPSQNVDGVPRRSALRSRELDPRARRRRRGSTPDDSPHRRRGARLVMSPSSVGGPGAQCSRDVFQGNTVARTCGATSRAGVRPGGRRAIRQS